MVALIDHTPERTGNPEKIDFVRDEKGNVILFTSVDEARDYQVDAHIEWAKVHEFIEH